MHLSEYLVIKKLKDKVILFSTISRTIIEVNYDFFNELSNLDKKLKIIKDDELAFLKKNYFIIDNDIDEKRIVDYLLDKDRLDQKVFSSYIAFSTLCNFSCVYCYEEGQVCRKKIMDNSTLDMTVDWYKRIIEKNNYTECRISLFGGEPLLHKDLIKDFINKISKIMEEKNILFSITMTTNGYLLDNDIIDFLDKNGLKEIQITLDGVGNIHDERRPLKNGGKTFNKIIENIKNAKKFNGRFLFRVSFDENNIDNVKELLTYISKFKIDNEYVVYLAPIHQTTEQKNDHCSFCSSNVYEDSQIMIDKYKELYSFMSSLGMKVPKYYTNGPCMIVSNDTVLVDPYGNLYKCVEMISIKNLCVGNVCDLDYNQKYYQFVGNPGFRKCIEKGCKYVALCGGGCLMQSYLSNKNIDNMNCEYEYFEQLIPFFLEVNYDTNK